MRFHLTNLKSQKHGAAFTMIEIALCLAIIGFGLVTIIGVLPTGLDVQKTNREETVIDQDAQVWMDALRSGAQGFNDLTNYVIGITNYWTIYRVTSTETNPINANYDGYGARGSHITSEPTLPGTYSVTNGLRIIGLLSMPTIMSPPPALPGSFQSNYVVAYVRAMSGSAADKFPQNNPEMLDNAFQYRMVVQNMPYVPAATNSMNLQVWNVLRANSHSLRLFFRWPVLPNGHLGQGRGTFRLLAGGQLMQTNDPTWGPDQPRLYLIQPTTFVNK